MAFCSTIKIEISDASGSYPDPGIVLVDFDDLLEQEISSNWSSLSQNSVPIDAVDEIVRGRGGRSRVLTFAVIRSHVDVETARRFILSHEAGLPGVTVAARITYPTDAADTPAAGYSTTRAHLESCSGSVTGGSETTHRYVLRWQMGT